MSIDHIKVRLEAVKIHLEEGKGIITTFKGVSHEVLENVHAIPNIIYYISNETKLTKASILAILTGINNLGLIFRNPQEFIISVIFIIKETLADFLINGIKYLKVDEWYKMELFEDIKTYQDIIIPVEKSIYDGISWSSDIERNFAEGLEAMPNVKLFIKLLLGSR